MEVKMCRFSVYSCLMILLLLPCLSFCNVKCPLCHLTNCETDKCSLDNLANSCGCCPICTDRKKFLDEGDICRDQSNHSMTVIKI